MTLSSQLSGGRCQPWTPAQLFSLWFLSSHQLNVPAFAGHFLGLYLLPCAQQQWQSCLPGLKDVPWALASGCLAYLETGLCSLPHSPTMDRVCAKGPDPSVQCHMGQSDMQGLDPRWGRTILMIARLQTVSRSSSTIFTSALTFLRHPNLFGSEAPSMTPATPCPQAMTSSPSCQPTGGACFLPAPQRRPHFLSSGPTTSF